MRLLSKVGAGILSALVLSASFIALPAQAQPTWHTVRPYILTDELVAFDSNGILWNYGRAYSDRIKIGQGWNGMADIHVTDWNIDGIQDILAKGKDGRLHIYWGIEDGGFAPVTIGRGWQNYEISVDYWKTTDDYPSIIAKNNVDGRIYNYPNPSGDSSVGARVLEGTGWGSLDLNLTDWDGDGGMDILAATTAGDILLYRTDGEGNFYSEARKRIGSGWNAMTHRGSFTSYGQASEQGLLARTGDGVLYYYGIGTGHWYPRDQIGTGWNGYTIARS